MSKKRQTEMKLLMLEARIYRANIRQDLDMLRDKTATVAPWAGAAGIAAMVLKLFRRNKDESGGAWGLRGISSVLWLLRRYLESHRQNS